jgi:pilus assembly protein FimV
MNVPSNETPITGFESEPDSAMQGDSEFNPSELQHQLDELSDMSSLDADLSEMTADIEESLPSKARSMADDPNSEALDQPISLDEAFASDELSDIQELDELEEPFRAVDEDAVQTKLDLARAYMEMGDSEGARSILDEVLQEGTPQQKDEATKLAGGLS